MVWLARLTIMAVHYEDAVQFNRLPIQSQLGEI